jgi:hypothetical protein
MPSPPLSDLLALVQSQHWLALILLATLVVRKWTGPDSKFPIVISPRWQPTVTAAGGLVYGFVSALQQGQSIGTALIVMAVSAGAGGFLDGTLTAIFDHDNAPKWAKAIVFIFDDLTGTTPKAEQPKAVSMRPPSKPPPPGPSPSKPTPPGAQS